MKVILENPEELRKFLREQIKPENYDSDAYEGKGFNWFHIFSAIKELLEENKTSHVWNEELEFANQYEDILKNHINSEFIEKVKELGFYGSKNRKSLS